MADRAKSLFLGPGTRFKQCPLRVSCAFGNNIYHAVYRICAPQAGAGTANHLDASNIFEHSILFVPKYS